MSQTNKLKTDANIHYNFETQVENNPEQVAVEFYDARLTYGELNKKANQLAHELLLHNDAPETRVAICIERSLEQIIAILAVLKAGASYIPIDPALPQQKIDMLLNEVDPEVTIVHNPTASYCTDRNTVNLDHSLSTNDTNPNRQTKPHHTAYIIFTSGSTGVPKGVMIDHGAVMNLIQSQLCTFQISIDRILLTSEIFFDASIEQIFLALLSGSTVICLSHETLKDKDKLEDYILSKQITHLHATPTLLNHLSLTISRVVKRVISGGDVCPPSLANNWIGVCDFYNEFGPTETTCTAVMSHLTHPVTDRAPIGTPLPHTNCYVVKDNKVVLDNQVGELWITGKSLAKGYFKSPQLTQEKFITTPFNGERAYKSGDMCRWTAHGELEFLRRDDFQIKFNGYRIELQEIETVILSYPTISDSIVIFANDALIAFCQGDTEGLESYLKHRLAAYMVPTYIKTISAFPLSSNGKIDRIKLKNDYLSLTKLSAIEEQDNNIKNKIIKIWQEVLMTSNFNEENDFYEAGGDSLKAMRAVIRIREVFNVQMEMSYFIDNPYIDSCVDYLIGRNPSTEQN